MSKPIISGTPIPTSSTGQDKTISNDNKQYNNDAWRLGNVDRYKKIISSLFFIIEWLILCFGCNIFPYDFARDSSAS